MWDARRFDLHDPKYGKVGELCRSLGYASERKGTPRSIYFLSHKTTTFRKKFVEQAPEIFHFPLEYESREAQLCASSFLAKNAQFFEDSVDAQSFGWPVYPRDAESLIENLAKLMCTQEYLYRRNTNYAESREKRDREEIEDGTPDESDSERSDVDPPFSPTVSHLHSTADNIGTTKSAKKTQEEQSVISAAEVRENIRIHNNFTYPLHDTLHHIEDDRSNSWIFASEKWPDDIKAFAWRYLHEHNLYTARKTNIDAVILFVQSLKRHLNITCTDAEDSVVQRRCERHISTNARLFRAWGFLEETEGVLRKSAQFEEAWRNHRSKWIDLVHNGDLTGVIELDGSFSMAGEGLNSGDSRKRSHAHTGSATNTSSSGAAKASAAKRPKFTSFEGTVGNSRTASEELPDFDIGRGRHETGSVEEEVIEEPRRAPEAPMLTVNTTVPKPTAKTVPVEIVQNGNPLGPHSSSANKDSNVNRNHPYSYSPSPSPSLQPDASSARSTATLDDGLNMLPPLEKRSRPYALKGASLNIPFDVDTALIKSAEMAPPGKPSKPKLHYILQNSRGVLDYDNPLSGEIFRTYNIYEFFNVVASRAGKADGSLACLTFVFNWGEREAFVVNRYGGDQYWEKIKDRVKGTFLDARNSMKKRSIFELWIKCGDTTNLDDAEEDDDW